ncbi:MerR family transcriptional regulator [Priestia abyssalis]|uniref:MerR family transcriptional regulator n=1 Tax=Priestia abyssalis TaxID=1221450 RepID=UPI0011176071|nr:MerR family transcriptional regulator [Priestia abyssalis]
MVETIEKAYTTKEISMTLGIGDSTLKKWCLSLEKNEYPFTRNDQNQRLFLEKDLVVLKLFQTMVQTNNFSVENAGMLIASKFKESGFPSGVSAIRIEEQSEKRRSYEVVQKPAAIIQYQEAYIQEQREFNQVLLESMREQKEFNQVLLERLEKQEKSIQEGLNTRDGELTQSIQGLQQQLNQLTIQTQEKRKQRKGLFKWFS